MWVTLAVAVLASAFNGDGKYGRWIDDLGHDDPAVRDEASLRLRAAGRAAWPDLETASSTHPDLEIRSRCRDIVATSRLRRRIPWRVLDEFPSAVATLQNGPSSERIALIRILARTYEDTADLLLDLAQDPDPEVVLAAAEYLQERRNTDWAPRLLEIYAREDCPRASRIYELLTMASGRLASADLQRLFSDAGPRGRNRILQLALNATLPLGVSPAILKGLLEGTEPATRRLGLSWLRERGCPGAMPFVEPLLSDPESVVVTDALSTLRACGWRPQGATLEALLGHDDPQVREEALQACLAFEERSCLDGLRRLLDDPSMSVRQSAITAVSRLGGAEVLDDLWRVFLRDSGESRDSAATTLARSPDWAMPRLRPLLKDADPDRRIRAYQLWARIDNVRVLGPLSKDRDETVRRWALLELLRRPEAPGAVEAIELFVADASESIRFDALRAMVRLEKRDHAPELEKFLVSREYSFRFDAAETLLSLRDERAQILARKLLDEADAPLRRLGYFALADRNDRDVADRAIKELNDPDGRLGGAAAKYLRQLLTGRHDDAVLARLAQGLDQWSGEPLELAFNLLMEYGDGAASGPIRKLVASGRAPRPDRAVRALADWAGEGAAVELSSLLGADALLNESVYSRLRDVRRRHPEAGRRDLEAALARLFCSPDRRIRRGAAQAASELGLPLEDLVALVQDREPSVRCAAMAAARLLSLAGAADAIEAKLDDDDPDVRVAAALSLASLKPAARPVVDRAMACEDCAWAKRKMETSLAPATTQIK
jgi:HEAT repeat protein